MLVNHGVFFDRLRVTPFNGRLTKGQVEGLEAILADCRTHSLGCATQTCERQALAYVLATTFHETAATMQPVRETLATTDGEAIARLERAFRAGRLKGVKSAYWRRDADGKTWLGRGFVQLTHKRNYEAMSRLTGIDLVAEPERAMQIEVAARILAGGMAAGSFTGRRLADCFVPGKADWTGARRIINGTDRAALVARHALAFAAALQIDGLGANSAGVGAGLSQEQL